MNKHLHGQKDTPISINSAVQRADEQTFLRPLPNPLSPFPYFPPFSSALPPIRLLSAREQNGEERRRSEQAALPLLQRREESLKRNEQSVSEFRFLSS